jgi:hypothetical protein
MSSRRRSGKQPRQDSTGTQPAVPSRGGLPRRVSVVELEKCAATSPNTAHPAQTADWTKSTASCQRADVRSQSFQRTLHPMTPRQCHFPGVDDGVCEHGVMRVARPRGAIPQATNGALTASRSYSNCHEHAVGIFGQWILSLTITRKWSKDDEHHTEPTSVSAAAASRKLASRDALDSIQTLTSAGTRRSLDAEAWHDEHVPHSICAFWTQSVTFPQSHGLTV